MTHERDTRRQRIKKYVVQEDKFVSGREKASKCNSAKIRGDTYTGTDDLSLYGKMLYNKYNSPSKQNPECFKACRTAMNHISNVSLGYVNSLLLNVWTEFEDVLLTGHFELVGEAEVLHLNLQGRQV